MSRAFTLAVAAGVAVVPSLLSAQATVDLPAVLPAALVDLRTEEGARLVQAQWRYSDVDIVAVSHHEPGPDLRASGAPNRTSDITPWTSRSGSVGCTPYSSFVIRRESNRAAAIPVSEPTKARRIPWRTISSRTSRRVAPSDMRTPISWVLRVAE